MTDRAFDLHRLRRQTVARIWLLSVSGLILLALAIDSFVGWLLREKISYILAFEETVVVVIAAGVFSILLSSAWARLDRVHAHARSLDAALTRAEERRRLQARASREYFLEYDAATDAMQFPEDWLAMLGCPPGTAGGLNAFIRCMAAEDRPRLEAGIRDILKGQGGTTFQMIHRANKGNGDLVWISSEVFVVERDSGGLPLRLLIGSRDITERKRIEEFTANMRHEMENQHALQVAVQTAAAIAHELNQPLSAVSGYCASALNIAGGLPVHEQETLAPLLQKAVQQAAQAGRVVHELLEFLQRDEAGAEIVNLNDAVAEALRLAHAGGNDDAQFRLSLDPAMQPVHVNRLQVQKVIANLVRNAIEAMAGAGMAAVDRRIGIETVLRDGMARVSVRDFGPGLDAAAAKQLFQPFHTTKPGGIGMGLVTSRALIESAGGRLWFEPAPEGGAVFHFTLPILQ